LAAEYAKLDEMYQVVEWPVQEPGPFDELLVGLSEEVSIQVVDPQMQIVYDYLKDIEQFSSQQGLQLSLPFVINY
ncbi:MAG: hypothetical protein ACI959_002297, partial [Limisphaerales bacterium]